MESEDDETLEYVAVVLTKVHSAFYELFDAKVNRFPVCLTNFPILKQNIQIFYNIFFPPLFFF